MTGKIRLLSLDAVQRGLAARSLGHGPPLVLINGYAATKDDWDPAFLRALARSSAVLCPDNRGVGDSGPSAAELSIASMADDVVALLDAREIARADVVGWSMGGYIAQEVAARAPGRVGRLVLLSTDPGGPGCVRPPAEVWARLIDHSGTPREQALRLIGLLFPPEFAVQVERVAGVIARARAALSEEGLGAQELAMARWHTLPSEQRLAAISIPALLAAGTEDQVIPPANSQLLADALPGSKLSLYEGGGHAFMAQQPERVAAQIEDWLGR